MTDELINGTDDDLQPAIEALKAAREREIQRHKAKLEQIDAALSGLLGKPIKKSTRLWQRIEQHIKENGPQSRAHLKKVAIEEGWLGTKRDPEAQVDKAIDVCLRSGKFKEIGGKIHIVE